MIEKILEKILLASSSCKAYKLVNPSKEDVAEMNAYKKCYEIVQEVAKEYEGKKYYRIVLSCLEDSTSLEMPLNKQEYLLLTRLSELVYRVATGCMPTMYVEQK